MLNNKIQSLDSLQFVLSNAKEYLSSVPLDTPYSMFEPKLQDLSLEKGWGDNAGHVPVMIELLLDLLQAPNS